MQYSRSKIDVVEMDAESAMHKSLFVQEMSEHVVCTAKGYSYCQEEVMGTET